MIFSPGKRAIVEDFQAYFRWKSSFYQVESIFMTFREFFSLQRGATVEGAMLRGVILEALQRDNIDYQIAESTVTLFTF